MANQNQPWDDTRVENIIGGLLQMGVLTSAGLVLLGGLWYLVHHWNGQTNYGSFHAEPAQYRTVTGVLLGVRSLDGRGIIQLGLLLLIATPVARVAFSAWAFAREHDRTYVVITLIVLAILTYSLAGSH